MLDVFFLLCWVSFPVVSWRFSKSAGIEFTRLSILGFLLIYIFVFQYLGFPILYFRLDEYRAEFVTDDTIILNTFFITSTSVFLIIVGAVLAKLATRWGRVAITAPWRVGGFLPMARAQSVVAWSVGAACCAVLISYVQKVGLMQLALVVALGAGAAGDVDSARSEMSNAFAGGYFWFQLFMQHGLLYVFLVFFASWLMFRDRHRIGAFFFGASVIFAFLMTGEKSLFGSLVIACFLVYTCVEKRGGVPLKAAGIMVAGVIGVIALLYQVFSGAQGLFPSIELVISRTLTGALQPAYHYVAMFPEVQGYLLGRSFPNPAGIFPFEPFLLTEEVMNYVDPTGVSRGIVGTMPTIFWGEMYANFGMSGVVVSSLLIGFVLWCLDAMLLRRLDSPWTVALFVWSMVHYSSLAITSFSTFIIDIPLALVFGISLLIESLRLHGSRWGRR